MIRTYSSRVHPTSRRATFVYHYSDFPYDEVEVLNDFFDVMLYMANWGSRRFMMKFPAHLVSYEALKEYDIDASDEYDQEIRVFKKGKNILVDMSLSFEGGEWIDAEGVLDEMLPIRNQVLHGDYRVLYLGWLHLASEHPDIPEDLREPRLPANLNQLDYSLESFVNFWEIDQDLIQAASEKSEEEKIISDDVLKSQIVHLSTEEKHQYLEELMDNEVGAKNKLKKRLNELYQGPQKENQQQARLFSEIMEGMAKQHKERMERERIAAEKAHLRKMERIGAQESKMWEEVGENAELKTAKGYEKATEILKELKMYHHFKKSQASFDLKLGGILDKYGRSVAFKRRMRSNGIL